MHILMMIHRLADASPYSFFVHEQARALVALGHTVEVIATVPVPPMMRRMQPHWADIVRKTPQAQEVDGVHVEYPRCLTLGDAGERLFGGRNYFRAILPVARRIHRRNPVDLIHAHMIDRDGHAGRLTADALGLPFVLTAHGTDVLRYFRPGERPLRRNVRTVQRADALMAVSEMLLERLRPYRPEGITEVVRNGLNLSELPDLPREKGRILSVGTLTPRKCMDVTIEAFAGLAGQFPEATLRIVGIGAQEEALRAQIGRLGLGDRVFLLGGLPHKDVMEEMVRADAFVLPSWGEGFGVVYIEAMAAGCVTIGSRDEGIADVIRDGENGFLVTAGSVEETRNRLLSVLQAPQRWEKMRSQAKTQAREMTWERNARETARIYEQVLAGYRPCSV